MKKILIALLLLLPLSLSAKSGYKITFIVDGNHDSVMYMGFYYAQYQYLCDTAYNNGKGKFVFEGKKDLLPGLYFLSNGNGHSTDFVVYREPQFYTLRTEEENWLLRMRVKGSKQNEVFFNYKRATETFYMEVDDLKASMDSAEFMQKEMPLLRDRMDSILTSFVDNYPDYMISRMTLSTKDITVPHNHPDGTPMTDQERFEWNMHHYFDNMPLDDDFIVRTPKWIFYQRVIDYVDKYMKNMPPDMIIPYLDSMIDRSEPAPEVFKWLVHSMTEHFLQSRVMVYDEIYCHLVLRYYGSGKAFWSSPSFIDEQVEQATKWERLLVGKVSPELILFDTLRNAHSLHHMPGRYTLLLFWSPTCGHCRDIIPAVYKVFEKYADSLTMSAFAILTEPDEQTIVKWKKFLADQQITDSRWVNLNGGEANVDWRQVYDITTTPQIYLIDNRDHKFLAKKLNAEILENILKTLNKNKNNLTQ
jgi:thiol-disulfide isomerase/thioredoxin